MGVVIVRRVLTPALAAVLGVAGFALATSIAGAGPPAAFTPGSIVGPGDHVPICHALGNGGYEAIAPSAGVVFGHAGNSHQDGRDVIPPFVYEPNKGDADRTLVAGQNWASGQALWANDCVAGVVTTTGTTTTTTTPATTTVPTTTTTATTTAPSTTTVPRTSTETATTETATTTETFTPPLLPATHTTPKPAAAEKPAGAVKGAHVTVKPSRLAFTP